MNGARRERAAVERQLIEDGVDTASKKARVNEAESRFEPVIAVEGRKASDTRHVTIANVETVSNCRLSRGDSAYAQNGAPDASAAAEKFGGTREKIPTDQPELWMTHHH